MLLWCVLKVGVGDGEWHSANIFAVLGLVLFKVRGSVLDVVGILMVGQNSRKRRAGPAAIFSAVALSELPRVLMSQQGWTMIMAAHSSSCFLVYNSFTLFIQFLNSFLTSHSP